MLLGFWLSPGLLEAQAVLRVAEQGHVHLLPGRRTALLCLWLLALCWLAITRLGPINLHARTCACTQGWVGVCFLATWLPSHSPAAMAAPGCASCCGSGLGCRLKIMCDPSASLYSPFSVDPPPICSSGASVSSPCRNTLKWIRCGPCHTIHPHPGQDYLQCQGLPRCGHGCWVQVAEVNVHICSLLPPCKSQVFR